MLTELEILLIVPSSWILCFKLHQIAVIVATLSRSYFSKTLPTEFWTFSCQKSRFDNKALSATDETLKAGVGGDTEKSQANMSKGINEEDD